MAIPDYNEFKKQVLDEIEPILKKFYEALSAGAGTPVEPQPEQPKPEEPTPTPQPEPEVPAPVDPPKEEPKPEEPVVEEPTPAPVTAFTITPNNYNSTDWVKGVWAQDRPGFSVPKTAEIQQALKNSNRVKLADGQQRTVTQVQEVGNNISLWIDGGKIDAAKVGYPNKIEVLDVKAEDVQTAPEAEKPTTGTPTAPTTPPVSGKRKQLPFDLNLMGINLASPCFGSNVPGTYNKDWTYPNRDHFKKYADMGMNLVRLPFKWERMQLALNGGFDAAELKRMDDCFQWAEELKMYIFPDMHNYLRRKVNGKEQMIGSSGCPTSAFIDFWVKMAKHYKGHKALFGYDIMNEPYPIQPSWAGIAQQTYDAIQKVDDTFVLVNGGHWANAHGWASKNPGFPLKGDNIIYQAHCYTDSNAGGLFNNRSEQINPQIGVQRLKEWVEWLKKHDAMGLLGELSAPYNMPTAIAALNEQIKYMIKENIPMTYWAGGPWWTATAANGIEVNGVFRAPINDIKAITGKKHTVRQIGPFK